jgi:apolipoprotein N-acyltransferase
MVPSMGFFHWQQNSGFINKKFILTAVLWVIMIISKRLYHIYTLWFFGRYPCYDTFIQLADISGVYGVTFIISLYKYSTDKFHNTKRRQPLITAVIIMIISTLYGIYMGDYYRNIENRPPHIKLL